MALQKQVETQSLISGDSGECMQVLENVEEKEEQWCERDFYLARNVWNKWKNHHFTSLRDALWGNAIFLKEANAISVELRKQVMFQFVLLTDTLLSPLSPELRPLELNSAKQSHPQTIVAVKVSDLKNGATHFWSLKKLRKRLDLMRKMYDQASDLLPDHLADAKSRFNPLSDKLSWFKLVSRGISSPRLHLSCIHHNPGDLTPPCYSSTPVNELSPSVSILSLPSTVQDKQSPTESLDVPNFVKSCSMSDLEYESAIYNLLSHQDPFYDRTPWFSIVGSNNLKSASSLHDAVKLTELTNLDNLSIHVIGFVYLTNLLGSVPLVHRMAIISEKGSIEGYLRVAVQPITGSNRSPNDDINNNKIQYNSRRSSATAHIEFCEDYDEQEDPFMDPVNGNDDHPLLLSKSLAMQKKKLYQKLSRFSSAKCDLALNMKSKLPIVKSSDPLKIGNTFEFRVTILDAFDISTEYADIFCQFNFINRLGESFSTEPINNTGGAPLAFYHVQNFSVEITQSFLDYISTHPIVFEIFGHFTQHPLHNQSRDLESMLKKSSLSSMSLLPLSKPVPATASSYFDITDGSDENADSNHSLLVWFEIREMEPCGEYTSVTVEHTNLVNGNSTYLLHQGIQRRIAVTLTHESTYEFSWKDVQEIVIGRIRYSQEASPDMFVDDEILSLSLLPTQYVKSTINDRTLYRFEAAWDSSLHNSALLNKVTPNGEKIYITLTSYIGLDNCIQPVVISKDLCLKICHRDAKLRSPRSIRNLFASSYSAVESNCISGIYDLSLKFNNGGSDSPGMRRRQRRVVDTSSTYVRGEENLAGWRPRGDSLILDHQLQLHKFNNVLQVEKSRHMILLKDVLAQNKDSLSDKEESEKEQITDGCDDSEETLRDADCAKQLTSKCVKLMQYKIPSIFDFQELDTSLHDSGLPEDPEMTPSNSNHSTMHQTNSSFEICSFSSVSSSPETETWVMPQHVATISEVRINPVISRQGYLNMLDSGTARWVKWWVVVRRPYVFFHNSHRDPVIRALFNLGTTSVEYSFQQDLMLKVPHTFTVCSKTRGFLLQAANEADLHNWLYAFNPLMAGSLRSKLARRNNSVKT